VYSTERALGEHGAKLSESERRAVEQALTDAREALKGDDAERIRQAQENLNRVSRMLAEAASRSTTSGPNGGAGSAGRAEPGDVVDAEFKDADDRKS
jgi:molecular chaperone DnaK